MRLIAQLGAKCSACGATSSLELDCIVPRGDDHHRLEMSMRATFYRREARAGNLQVLCERCNAAKGAGTMQQLIHLLYDTASDGTQVSSIKGGE